MSRRGVSNPAAERAAQNQQTIKTLLKLEPNKSCADCKRNKHPRWASWNLGVFVCIRCSGIHRGMGTHISRVKSVDLDAWTDEQLQNILRWGNARANKYYEAKLAPGHVPSEAKIENFIRTKYDSKRWVIDGPMPDPSTLDAEGDDDVPLNVVQEKAKLERGSSQRASASTNSQPVPPPKPATQVDLFGDIPQPPVRPSTTDAPASRPPPPKNAPPPKQTKASDSLLGLDFFGGPPTASAGRPNSSASTPSGSTGPSRPDLKQSILSLYASAPKPQPAPQHDRQSSFGGMQSPPAQQGGFGGLGDAFSNLSFASPASPPSKPQPATKSDPFGDFTSPTPKASAAPAQVTSPFGGGSFFDTSPKPTPKPSVQNKPMPTPSAKMTPLASNDLKDFNFASSAAPAPSPAKPPPPSASSDLFDMSDPMPQSAPAAAPTQASRAPAPAPVPASVPSSDLSSAFNLSNPAPPSKPTNEAHTTKRPSISKPLSNFSNNDPWGSDNAWATPDPTPAPPPSAPQPKAAAAAPAKPPSIPMASDFSAWGGAPSTTSNTNTQSSGFSNNFGGGMTTSSAPKVTPDEDFGGWSSAGPESPVATNPAPPSQAKSGGGGGFGGSDDLFSNVWE